MLFAFQWRLFQEIFHVDGFNRIRNEGCAEIH